MSATLRELQLLLRRQAGDEKLLQIPLQCTCELLASNTQAYTDLKLYHVAYVKVRVIDGSMNEASITYRLTGST